MTANQPQGNGDKRGHARLEDHNRGDNVVRCDTDRDGDKQDGHPINRSNNEHDCHGQSELIVKPGSDSDRIGNYELDGNPVKYSTHPAPSDTVKTYCRQGATSFSER
jgi:hypothetical protein